MITVDGGGWPWRDPGMATPPPDAMIRRRHELLDSVRALRPLLVDLVDNNREQVRAALDDAATGRLGFVFELPAGARVEWGTWSGRGPDGATYSPVDGNEGAAPEWAWEVIHSARPTMATLWLRLRKGDVLRLREGLERETAGGDRPGLLSKVAVKVEFAGDSTLGGTRVARMAEAPRVSLRDLGVEGSSWVEYSCAIGLAGSADEAAEGARRVCGEETTNAPGAREARNLERTIGAMAMVLADKVPHEFVDKKTGLPNQKGIAAAVQEALSRRQLPDSGMSTQSLTGRVRAGLRSYGLIKAGKDSR